MSTTSAERFRTVYEYGYDAVLGYVKRRISSGAEDVVCEAMTVAWRRVEELPHEPKDATAWLIGIARNCLLNQRRTLRRQNALTVRIAEANSIAGDDCGDEAIARADLARAWARLDAAEADVLALSIFDGLDSEQAGQVFGFSANAYRLRLSRARTALQNHLSGKGLGDHDDASR